MKTPGNEDETVKKELEKIQRLTWDYRACRILQTAVLLKIFTRLDEKAQNCGQLSSLCRAKPQMLEKVLVACAAMGLVKKEGPLYRNTKTAAHYLVEGKLLYQGNIIAHSARVWRFWDNLPDEISEKPLPADNDQTHRDFILGMHNIAMAGRAELFIKSIDLTGRKRMFDLGGGPGTYSIFACKKYPKLEAVVFDLPQTIDITKQIIKREKLQNRIRTQPGNWETDDFGKNYDVVLMSNILHGPDSSALMKLQKARACLVQGGLLVIQEFILNSSKTGPLIPALFNVMVGAYSKKELFAAVRQAGFSNLKLVVEDKHSGGSWITAEKRQP